MNKSRRSFLKLALVPAVAAVGCRVVEPKRGARTIEALPGGVAASVDVQREGMAMRSVVRLQIPSVHFEPGDVINVDNNAVAIAIDASDADGYVTCCLQGYVHHA